MRKHFSNWSKIITILIAFIFLVNIKYISALALKEEAEGYRTEGYKAQQIGDIDKAISWYQKAANLDVNYAAPHNDLGILFEAKGWLDRAEAEYKNAIAINHDYANAHTNLAILYERKGELEKAAFHWMRRYKLGKTDDPWTQEAKQRLEKLGLVEKKDVKAEQPKVKEITHVKPSPVSKEPKVKKPAKPRKTKKNIKKPAKVKKTKDKASDWTLLGSKSKASKKEKTAPVEKKKNKKSDIDKELQESLKLAEERLRQDRNKAVGAELMKKPDSAKAKSSSGARSYVAKANNYVEKGEYSRALDTIRTAKKEYPGNQDLLNLEDSVKNKMKEERIKDHYNEGLMRYRENNFSGARKEFEAILNILPE